MAGNMVLNMVRYMASCSFQNLFVEVWNLVQRYFFRLGKRDSLKILQTNNLFDIWINAQNGQFYKAV